MDSSEKILWSWVTVILFCLFIYGMGAAMALKPTSDFSETENRMLAQMPAVDADSILSGEFETDYEEYLTDQFPWRDGWVGIKTAAERLSFKTESKDIYFAADGYLIEKHTGAFAAPLAQRNATALAEFVKMYDGLFGAGHISVIVVPNAVDILDDKLPPFAASGGGSDYLARLAESLPEYAWLDAEAVLCRHKDENLYYRTDHHWKTIAAFYVYVAWAQEHGYSVPELTDYDIQTVTDSFEGTVQSKMGIKTAGDTIELFFPKTESTYTVQRGETTGDSLYDYDALSTKDKYAVFLGGNEPLLRITTEAENGRRILVIKDSYANCFIPFMLTEFQELDIIDLRYTSQRLSELIGTGEYTDILVLYNVSGFAEDVSVSRLTN